MHTFKKLPTINPKTNAMTSRKIPSGTNRICHKAHMPTRSRDHAIAPAAMSSLQLLSRSPFDPYAWLLSGDWKPFGAPGLTPG
jgi:hypothetical protein